MRLASRGSASISLRTDVDQRFGDVAAAAAAGALRRVDALGLADEVVHGSAVVGDQAHRKGAGVRGVSATWPTRGAAEALEPGVRELPVLALDLQAQVGGGLPLRALVRILLRKLETHETRGESRS